MATSSLTTASREVLTEPPPPLFDLAAVRADFPILAQLVNGHPLVYLDNAATTQKPRSVIESLQNYYERDNANIHRGVHTLSQRATEAYEQARARVARFIGADPGEIVFVRGTTEAINLVAHSFVRPRLRAGDNIVLSAMEHHANIVPWQLACQAVGASLRIIPMSDAGVLDLDQYARLLDDRTRLVGLVHVSNALGTVNPVRAMIATAHQLGIPVLLDAAQSISHQTLSVAALDCDFLAFSGHKIYGPTGFGVLYGKRRLLEEMPPWQGGGDMIRSVSFENSTFKAPPERFEAGTPHIAGAIAMAAALDYWERLGVDRIAAWEAALLRYATQRLCEIPGLRVIGTAPDKAGVLSFVMAGAHPHDIGTFLDDQGIAIRAGHHCTQPLMKRLGLTGTARASFSFYNTTQEVDRLTAAVQRVSDFFRP